MKKTALTLLSVAALGFAAPVFALDTAQNTPYADELCNEQKTVALAEKEELVAQKNAILAQISAEQAKLDELNADLAKLELAKQHQALDRDNAASGNQVGAGVNYDGLSTDEHQLRAQIDLYKGKLQESNAELAKIEAEIVVKENLINNCPATETAAKETETPATPAPKAKDKQEVKNVKAADTAKGNKSLPKTSAAK